MLKSLLRVLLISTLLLEGCGTMKTTLDPISNYDDAFSIEYPEVYELANIVLALTEYGISDKWQVRKDFEYYEEMREYFKPYEDHPLITAVNFSKERWKEYLSYRTDSYAYIFDDKDQLKRINKFKSFNIKTFDKYKDLTEDFAQKSNFRTFFNEHREYYDQIVDNYKKEYLLSEMKTFLINEFGNYFAHKKYSIVISPFVSAQNLHRDINSNWTADFPSIAKPIISGQSFESIEEKSTEIHTLFTEMDHGYVNPTTKKYKVSESFNEKLWDDESGYDRSRNAVFNEYMTWAVFDLFNSMHFPDIAKKINLNWHFQNDMRGFPYSNLFASKLKEMYNSYEGKKSIEDLYPEMLEWTKEIQSQLSKPTLLNDGNTIEVHSSENFVELQFSEPMVKIDKFELVLSFDQWNKKVIKVNNANNLKWEENGKSLVFEIVLPQKEEYSLLLNWWGVENPLVSKKGVMLHATSGFIIKGNPAQSNK